MSVGTNPYLKYRQNSIETASGEQLLLMLYDGAVRFLRNAVLSIEKQDFEGAHNSIVRVQDIIGELICTLNMDYEISGYLRQLYEYFLERLIEANVKKDKDIAVEILNFLSELRETWAQAVVKARDGGMRVDSNE
ncbi:MAG: Flagellar protein FliS [Pelotomaculum sp. PtaB.Bin104]|nr:MAG: Flagellar protein FliS [Pelotomaculum sp. PtaB.Bin104]